MNLLNLIRETIRDMDEGQMKTSLITQKMHPYFEFFR